MTAVVFYFQVHQPYRLRPYGFFDIGGEPKYFDDHLNRLVAERVAERCYLPMNELLLDAIERTEGRFRCAFSITGTVLSQLQEWAPQVIDSFAALVETGCVELLAETSHHSLAWTADREEFRCEVEDHRDRIEALFGQRPLSFRNTELVIDSELGPELESLGFEVLLGEGADPLLQGRSPRHAWRPRGCQKLRLLLRDYLFSDDIAFRFSNPEWESFPLQADTFASWLHKLAPEAFIGLFMDYETFGEHQAESTGILEFMKYLPEFVLEDERFEFRTPIEVAHSSPSPPELEIPRTFSWADAERDLTAWLGNPMQKAAQKALYRLLPKMREVAAGPPAHPELLESWRRLATSDHVYYMCTKFLSDQDVHEYFSPYATPHDAFVNFMNILDDFERRVESTRGALREETK